MRIACLALALTLNLALAAQAQSPAPASSPAQDTAKSAPDTTTRSAAPAPAASSPTAVGDTADAVPAQDTTSSAQGQAPDTTAAASGEALEGPVPEEVEGSASVDTVPPAALAEPLPPVPTSRRLFTDYGLAGREYIFGVVGQTVAGALGFFIGSAIETAIAGEEEAHKGTLSFTGIRYDNYYGAFWGGAMGGLAGSTLAVYFTGQSDEEDGSFWWTMVGTATAGAGALYAAHLMGVNDDVDWKPFLPLLALPSAGGVLGFNVSRWFSDRKRERILGPDTGIRIHPPRLALGWDGRGERVQLQALNLTF